MKLNRKVKTIGLVSIITVAFIVGGIILSVNYAGGWETSSGFSKVHCYTDAFTGYGYNVPVSDFTVTGPGTRIISWSDQAITIDTNKGSESGGCPSGAPDIVLTKGLNRHVVMGFTGLETATASDAQQEYSKTVGNITYYYEWHMYAFEVEVRTASNYKNTGSIHEGTMLGSYGSPVTTWVYVTFTINPWDIVGAYKGQNFTDEQGNSYRLVDGWAGIMSARISPFEKDLLFGIVPGTDPHFYSETQPFNEGYEAAKVFAKPTASQALSMFDSLTGAQISGYQYTSPAALKNVPQQVTIEIPMGKMASGSHSHYVFGRSWIEPVEVRVQVTVIVDILQVKGYTLITGDMPPKGDDNDFNPSGASFNWIDAIAGLFGWLSTLFWVAVILIGFFLVVKILTARSTKVYVGRGTK
jgi:hypothetical protein